MTQPDTGTVFAGSIPKVYDSLLVPLLFEPYAVDLVERLKNRPLHRLLEIAAGTGVVTRRLAESLPDSVAIVATDLNQPMLDHAAAVGTARPVQWQRADAMQLPFPDASFDAVVCQFGVMFFPDKAKAFGEARRVLSPGGVFIFNAWDRIEDNEIAATVTTALAQVFPADPPLFMARIPHGYFDLATIGNDLKQGGFTTTPRTAVVSARSRAPSARDAAIAYCHGTPLRNEIEARDPARLEAATDAAERAIAVRFGSGAIDAKVQAHVVVVER